MTDPYRSAAAEGPAEAAPKPARVNPRLVEACARAAHEVNRAYCVQLGDYSQPAWEDAPEWQRGSARKGAEMHLLADHGPEASHEAWLAEKRREGWVFGPVKDPAKKEHPCMVPFAQLPPSQQAKDVLFRTVIHGVQSVWVDPEPENQEWSMNQ